MSMLNTIAPSDSITVAGPTTTVHRTHRRLGRCLTLLLLTVLFSAPTVSVVSAAESVMTVGGTPGPITVYQTGSPGSWRYTYGRFIGCLAGARRTVFTDSFAVGFSPSYASTQQRVYALTLLERWNGSSWEGAAATNWQHHVNHQGWAAFSSTGFDLNMAGQYWRIVQRFQWYVGTTKVAEVINYHNGRSYFGDDYNSFTYNPDGPGFCWIR